MGVACSDLVQDKTQDVEHCAIKSTGVGIDSEPLWKQMAEAQIALRKAAEEARPEVEKLLEERAAAKQAAVKQAEERLAKEARLKELELRQKEEEEEKAGKRREEAKKPQAVSGKAKPKAKDKAAGEEAAKSGTAAGQTAKLTKDQAKDALNRAVAIFELPENRQKLQDAVSSCHGDEAKKMAVLMPLVQGMLKDLLESHGFGADRMLHAVMQISTHAQGDKKMSKQLAKLQAALEGNL